MIIINTIKQWENQSQFRFKRIEPRSKLYCLETISLKYL